MNQPSLSPLRVAPGGRYFETHDGEPFLMLGANDAISWPGLEPLLDRKDVEAVESYLRTFSENGATIVRIMLEYAEYDGYLLENPVGHFVPRMVQFWDDLFDMGERLGLRFLVSPWDTFWMTRRWEHHPYNARNGGPAQQKTDFLNSDAVTQAIIRRFEWVIERYAHRAVLAAWDLFNEIWTHWGGTPATQSEIITQLSRAIREAEMRVQGWTRLQTISIFGPNPSGGYERLIFDHPDLDFNTTHIYWPRTIDFPRDTVAAALAMGRWTRYGVLQTPPGRPFTDSEHGPIHLFNDHERWLREPFDNEYERHLMWAHLTSGGAGSGMRWPARFPHVLTEGMKSAFKGLSAFAKEIDWRPFTPRDWRAKTRLEGAAEAKVHRFAISDGEQAVIFLLRKPPAGHRGKMPRMAQLRGTTLVVRGLQGTQMRHVCVFDPMQGQVVNETCVPVVNGEISVPLLAWQHELAVAVRPEKANPLRSDLRD